jgi:nitrate/nitrite-specific signal transduction histidine kinase
MQTFRLPYFVDPSTETTEKHVESLQRKHHKPLIPKPDGSPVALGQEMEPRFSRLVAEWKKETRFHSSEVHKCMHRAYQEIIAMGIEAVPLIFREMRRDEDDWFWALRMITGQNPVRQEYLGQMHRMTEAWLAWGQEHGYVV